MAWKLATAYVEVVGELSRFKRDLLTAQQRIKRFGASAARIAFGTAAAMAAIIIPTMRLVREFARFERQLSMVSTMLDEQSMKLLPAYRTRIRGLAKELGESTDALSKAMYDILSASIAPTEALRVLAVTARAAKAGFTDAATATDAVTSILNAFGLEAQEATRISDILFATVKRGKLTFGELAGSIGTVAATANMAGLSLEEMTAFIATVTRAGIRAHEAVTSLNAVLRAFLSPTTEAKRKARELGFELSANTLRTRGLLGVMRQLTDAQAEELAVIFPRIRGLKGVAAALKDVAGFAHDVQLMHASAGASMEAFAKVAEDTQTKLDRFSESWKALKVAMGERIAPAAIYAAEEYTALIEGYGAYKKEMEETRIGLRALMEEDRERIRQIREAPWTPPVGLKHWEQLFEHHLKLYREVTKAIQKADREGIEEKRQLGIEAFGEREALWVKEFRAEEELARRRLLLNGQTLDDMLAEGKRFTEMWGNETLKRYYSDAEIMERYRDDLKLFAKDIRKEIMGTVEAGATMIKGVEAARRRGGFGRVQGMRAQIKMEDPGTHKAIRDQTKTLGTKLDAIADKVGVPAGAAWGP